MKHGKLYPDLATPFCVWLFYPLDLTDTSLAVLRVSRRDSRGRRERYSVHSAPFIRGTELSYELDRSTDERNKVFNQICSGRIAPCFSCLFFLSRPTPRAASNHSCPGPTFPCFGRPRRAVALEVLHPMGRQVDCSLMTSVPVQLYGSAILAARHACTYARARVCLYSVLSALAGASV